VSRSTALSTREVSDFFEIGWITRRALFSASEVEQMRCCFDALERTARAMPCTGLREGAYFVLADGDTGTIIKRVVWAGGAQRYLLAIGSDPRLTVPSAQLLGSQSMDHLLNQAHFKHPNDGVTFAWHQDIEHRDKGNASWIDVNGRGSFVQTLIVLDEMTPDSGPLKFVRGSAKWGRIEFDDGWYERQTARGGAGRTSRNPIVTIAAEPGDALYFGPYAAHASFANTSDHPRRVLINGYAYPGANRRIYPGDGAGRRLSTSTVPAARTRRQRLERVGASPGRREIR